MAKYILFFTIMLLSIAGISQETRDKIPTSLNTEILQKLTMHGSKLADFRDWLHLNSRNTQHRAGTVKFSWPMRVNSNYDDVPGYYSLDNYMDILRDSASHYSKKDWYCFSHTLALNYRFHEGNDYSLYPFNWRMMDNNNVFASAAASGIVIGVRDTVNNEYNCMRSDSENDRPNYVALLHSDSSITRYLHLKTGTARVIEGQYVEEGQLLANIASSGNSSNPHLHFDLKFFREPNENYDFIEPFDRPGDTNSETGCNPHTASSWWKEQKTYLAPQINRVMTHSALPYLTGDLNDEYKGDFCPESEVPRAKNNFSPGQSLVVGVALVHVNSDDSIHTSIFYPNGTLWLSKAAGVPDKRDGSFINFRRKLYMTHTQTIPGNAPQGTYVVETKFIHRPFDATNPYIPATAPITTYARHYFTVGCEVSKNITASPGNNYGVIVSDFITNTHNVSSAGKVLLQAGNAITFSPGFDAAAGSTVKARIKPCDYVQ